MVFIRQNNVTNGFQKTMVWKCLRRDKTMANGLNFLEDLLRKCPAEHEDYFTISCAFLSPKSASHTCVWDACKRSVCVCIGLSMYLCYCSITLLLSAHATSSLCSIGRVISMEGTPTEVYIYRTLRSVSLLNQVMTVCALTLCLNKSSCSAVQWSVEWPIVFRRQTKFITE